MTIYVIEEGAVGREEGVVDNLALLQQIGFSPGERTRVHRTRSSRARSSPDPRRRCVCYRPKPGRIGFGVKRPRPQGG